MEQFVLESEKKIMQRRRNIKKTAVGAISDSTTSLPQQYNANLGSLAPGSVVLPPEQARSYLQALKEKSDQEPETAKATDKPAESSNASRAKAMLQLANGSYIMHNTRFRVSERVSHVMSRQSFAQQTTATGHIYVDGGTKVSMMGRQFRVTELTMRTAEMTGFANDLTKANVPIGSGLTKCTHKGTGLQYLMGFHEAPYLENNEGSLLSTGQTREHGIWLSDVLKRHGGDQRIVAPFDNSDQFLDMPLDVTDGLLAIECEYPSDEEMNTLPRVWVTSNAQPWDPNTLNSDDDIVIPSCWDGISPLSTLDENTPVQLGLNQPGDGLTMFHPMMATLFFGTCLLTSWF